MRDDSYEDAQRDTAMSEEQRNIDERMKAGATGHEGELESAESETEGSDVHDLTREGVTHGVDVTTNAENLNVESEGRTVVDRSHRVETHGVDVFDLGPNPPIDEEPLER